MYFPILSILIWLPMIGAIPVLMLQGKQHENKARFVALGISTFLLILSGVLVFQFDITTTVMQFRETFPWIPVMNLNYDVGVDGISMPLIVLTCFSTFIIVLASWTMVRERVAQYLAAFLVMQSMVIGVFAALDAIL